MKGVAVGGEVLHLQAPCKINMMLRVVGRRVDGYHELETWMQKLDLYDEIELELTSQPGITLVCDDPDLPVDETNLAYRAAKIYFESSKRAKGFGAALNLKKRIPSGAGLGGGSSDAGTVLRGLNHHFGDEFSQEELVRKAACLGADVPFFVVPYSAVMATGIGEVMQPVEPLTSCTIVLVNPGFSVSTKWVFENLALTTKIEESILPRFRKHDIETLSYNDMCNDLELVTSMKFSEIEQMKHDLLNTGASRAMMSGSGPTVFGVFPDDKSGQVAVQDAAEMLRQQYKDGVFVTRSCVGAWPSGQGTGF
ncbi:MULTISPECIES: 4-(cytidine 5'-diphospho)-2-C-methyl-D-erythritol kinase [Desulfosediminicola]|uniref:4-(cytidine 5'-diphospho)-2-C-methyl-D-erythritol kinase n=1 Tax=Desulfosediminicola TaxID=2886823 RepID=UPI0010AC5AF7|nr:4-(cytidine 5'-diphospho)-2-C-methyl-D-erythritol kinase [Desulfosediminicola ganghwensis]